MQTMVYMDRVRGRVDVGCTLMRTIIVCLPAQRSPDKVCHRSNSRTHHRAVLPVRRWRVGHMLHDGHIRRSRSRQLGPTVLTHLGTHLRRKMLPADLHMTLIL